MKDYPFSLRFSIPAILLLFGSILSFCSFQWEISESYRRTEQEASHEIRFMGNQISGILAYLYRRGDREQAEIVLSKMGSDSKLKLALLWDENNRILLATRYELRDRPVAETPVRISASVSLAVRQKMVGQILLSRDRQSIQAIYPVVLGAVPGELRPSKIGILFLEYDLSALKQGVYRNAMARSLEVGAVLALFCTALWLFFDRLLTRRVSKLVTASNSLAQGQLQIRTRLSGSDELAQISTAFDRMAERIQQDTRALQKSEERFRSLVANIPGVVYRCACDRDWTMAFISDAIAELSGYPAADLIRNQARTFASLIDPQDREIVEQVVERGIAAQQPYTIEYRIRHADGSTRWVYEQGQAVYGDNGEILCLDGAIFDISDRKHREETLQLIVEGTASATGDEFFRSCVRCLAEVLNVRYAVVAEFANEAKDRARTLAFWQDGQLGKNFEYDLAGTPCEKVLAGQIGYYPQHVQTLFPEALGLIQMGVQSFLGIPLVTAEGAVVGHLVAMDSRPMGDSRPYEPILRIFAARAAAELGRKCAERALRESEEIRRLALEFAPIGSWDWSIATNEVRWDENTFRLLGYEPNQVRPTYQNWRDRVYPDDIERIEQIKVRTLENRQQIDEEYRIVLPDGSIRWLAEKARGIYNEEGQPLRMVGLILDTTERKQLELALQASEAKLNHILDSAIAAIASYRMFPAARSASLRELPLKYERISAGCERVFGYTAEEFMSDMTLWQSRVWPDDAEKVVMPALERLVSERTAKIEYRFQHKDGTLRWIAETLTAQWDDAADCWAIATVATDISDLKAAEVALKQAKETAEVANRAKSEFLARMSHELRTPLNAILGFAQMMNRDRALSPEHQQAIDIINRSGEHLLALINDVLEMSKIEAGRIKLNETSFDLYRLLDTLEEMLHLKAANKGLTLTFERESNLPQYVATDESKLRQVLLNLLGNAIKFTPQGNVALRAGMGWGDEGTGRRGDGVEGEQGSRGDGEMGRENSQLSSAFPQSKIQKQIAAQSSVCGDNPKSVFQNLKFEVEDTGVGIAPEEMKTLFEAFVQTEIGRRSQQGTGLGLAISRKFVQLMGGELQVKSTLGQGSLFAFDIQVKIATAARAETSPTHQRVKALAPNQPRYRLLVVDDNWEHRQLMLQLLTPLGFEMRQAENGQEAIALWQTWEPHLIFMDMGMPVMNGHEATIAIKSTTQGQATVIIALTANAFEDERALVLSEGCDGFISKPFREDEIFDRLAKHLGVLYLYESKPQKDRNLAPTVDELTPMDWATMPSEWVQQLRQAVSACSERQILELLEEIPIESAALKAVLLELASDFRYDKILELTASV